MKQEIAEVLARSNVVGEITISRGSAPGWAVALHGHDGAHIGGNHRAILETARGSIRMFKSLDTAQAWVEQLLGGEDRDPGVIVTLNW